MKLKAAWEIPVEVPVVVVPEQEVVLWVDVEELEVLEVEDEELVEEDVCVLVELEEDDEVEVCVDEEETAEDVTVELFELEPVPAVFAERNT